MTEPAQAEDRDRADVAPEKPGEPEPGDVLSLGKVGITRMADWANEEAERLDVWRSTTSDPQHRLWMLQRAHVARMTARALDLLAAKQKQFVSLLKAEDEVAARAAKRKT